MEDEKLFEQKEEVFDEKPSKKKKNIPESASKETAQEKINCYTFAEQKKVKWPVRARLVHAVETKRVAEENTLAEWEKILKGL
jgi:hypothetical protein